MNSTSHPPPGLWRPHRLKHLYYGGDQNSRVAIITGNSLATRTPLIKELEDILGDEYHALTLSPITEHAPVSDLKQAAQIIGDNREIDTLISVGGGSPIDSAKRIAIRVQDTRLPETQGGHTANDGYLTHISIPTTLSAAECTAHSTYTNEQDEKAAIGGHPATAVLYDPHYASYTPPKLWLASGIRALHHAIELMYHPSTSEVSAKASCVQSVAALFEYLPMAKETHTGTGICEPEVTIRLFLATLGSLEFLGGNMTGGLGLSHALGYALGSTYGIPHGKTSCITLGHTVKLKAQDNAEDAARIARCLPYATGTGSVWMRKSSRDANVENALKVGNAVLQLVEDLGFTKTLTEYSVTRDQTESIVVQALEGKVSGVVSGIDSQSYEEVKELVKGLFQTQ